MTFKALAFDLYGRMSKDSIDFLRQVALAMVSTSLYEKSVADRICRGRMRLAVAQAVGLVFTRQHLPE